MDMWKRLKDIERIEVFNLGTRTPDSALAVVKAFERISGLESRCTFGEQRDGDLETVWDDTYKVKQILGGRRCELCVNTHGNSIKIILMGLNVIIRLER